MHSRDFSPTAEDRAFSEHDEHPLNVADQFVFHYNSDMSGRIHIELWENGMLKTEFVEIPGWMLLNFVGEFIGTELISKVESMDGGELLQYLIGN